MPRFWPGLCFAQIYFENTATFSEFVRLIGIHLFGDGIVRNILDYKPDKREDLCWAD